MRLDHAAAAGALALAAAGTALAEPLWFVAALPLAGLVLAGAVSRAPEPRLEAERAVAPAFLAPGGRVEVRVVVRNAGERLDRLVLGDRLPEGCRVVAGNAAWEGSLEQGGLALLGYTLEANRGVHRFESVDARAESLLLGIASVAELPCPGLAVAAPRDLSIPPPVLAAELARSFAGRSRERRIGSGSDFAGTREYRPGDPPRSLNWRAGSRWDLDVVNVFEEEKAIDVGIILDARAAAYEDQDGFERGVSAASSLALALLESGSRVAFLRYGATIDRVAPGMGREQELRIRLAAAGASLGNHAVFERFDSIPVAFFPPRSAILLVSPLLREDARPLESLSRLGYAVTVLRPLPAWGRRGPAAGDDTQEDKDKALARRILGLEASVLAARLRDAGIEVLDWEEGRPLASVARIRGRGRR